MFSCCKERKLSTGISGVRFRDPDPVNFEQKLIWELFPPGKVFINTIGNREYFYSWFELRAHPNFIVTKWVQRSGHTHVTFTRRLEPEIYPFVYRYIRYNIRMDVAAISNRLICSPEEVVMLLSEYGIDCNDNKACINSPPVVTDNEDNEYSIS